MKQGEKEIMSESFADNKALGNVHVYDKNGILAVDLRDARFSVYKFILFLLDFVTINLGFYISASLSSGVLLWGSITNYLLFTLFSLLILCFFPNFGLYNYHNIFYRKRHTKQILKAFGLSMVSFCLLYFVFNYPISIEGKAGYVTAAFVAIAILVISRFFWSHILDIARAFGVSFIVIGIISMLSPDETPPVLLDLVIIPAGVCMAIVLNIVCRTILVQYVFNKLFRRLFRRQLAIVGSDRDAEQIVSHIIEQDAPFYVKGIFCGNEVDGLDSCVPKERLGNLRDLPEVAESTEINEIIVTDESIGQQTLISLLDYCTSKGKTIWFPPRLLPIIDMKLYVDNFCGLPMIRLCSQKNMWLFSKIKHVFDLIMGIPIFLILLPFFIILGIIIKINSSGPVFYRAKAIGKNGKQFIMYKFRSMRIDSNNDKHKEFVTKMIKGEIDYEGKKDQVFKIIDDPRITSVGKFIRKYSIDELPQIINVLKGNMSLVGPRPCLPYEYEAYEDWHKKRLSANPGISGLWQVAGRSAVTFEDMIILDLYYIYNRSLSMDLSIIYETIYTVLGKRGAY